MAIKSHRKEQEDPKLDMTPMIDVVFELMIFFVVNLKQDDIFSKLNANRPAPNTNQATTPNDTQVKIDIGPGGFIFNGRGVSKTELNRNIASIARTSKSTTVLVRCTLDSPHMFLVEALDACHQYGLENLSIFSM